MKFNCGPTSEERRKAKEEWHPWFAWHPVRIGSGDCRWLETVDRLGTCYRGYGGDFWSWSYRPMKGE